VIYSWLSTICENWVRFWILYVTKNQRNTQKAGTWRKGEKDQGLVEYDEFLDKFKTKDGQERSHVEDKQKRKKVKQVGGSSSDIPMPTDRLHETFVVREEDEADRARMKWVWIGWGIQEERYMLVVGPGRHTITKNIDIMTLEQVQFSSVTLHVGNHGEKEWGEIQKKTASRHRNYIIVQLHPCDGGA